MIHYITMPFYDHKGQPQVRNARFITPTDKLDTRLATRLLRKQYWKLIGRQVPKSLIRKLIREKFSCKAKDITAEDIIDAINLFESTKKSPKKTLSGSSTEAG